MYDGSRWRRWHSPSTTTWSRHSRRIEPISRSAYPFCHGERGDVHVCNILPVAAMVRIFIRQAGPATLAARRSPPNAIYAKRSREPRRVQPACNILEPRILERLPPSVSHSDLTLLGKILEVRPTAASTTALRLGFFDKYFSWASLVDFANAHDLLAPLIFALRERSLLFPVPHSSDSATREKHVTSRLTSTWNQHLERQDDLRDQLLTIIAALNEGEITPLL